MGYDAPSPPQGYSTGTPEYGYSPTPGVYPTHGHTAPTGFPTQYNPGGGYGAATPVGTAPQRTNGFAIAALVCGIIAPCGAGLLALVFGILALGQISRNRQKGKGLAISGLALTGLWFVAGITAVVIAIATSGADRGEDGSLEAAGPISVTALRPGDCVEELDIGRVGFTVPGVPCDEPHQAEVYSVFDVTLDGSWPGEADVVDEAEQRCLRDLEQQFPEVYADTEVDIFYLHPSEATWRTGDREVVCFTYYLDGQRTGSILD